MQEAYFSRTLFLYERRLTIAGKLNIGLLGASGYWGGILLKNLLDIEEVRIGALASHTAPASSLGSLVPSGDALLTREPREIFARSDIDAVVIATSTGTHYPLALQAIRAGKHLFLEKPPALSSREVSFLAEEARRHGVIVVVDHIYLFSTHFQRMDEMVRQGAVGDLLHLFSLRANFGLFRLDSDTLSDLGYHDLYIIRRLFSSKRPVSATCSTTCNFRRGHANACSFSIHFTGRMSADVFLSWLSPTKERRIIVAGTEGMIEFRNDRELLLHRKGVSLTRPGFSVSDQGTRTIDVPGTGSPLRNILLHFCHCVNRGEESSFCSLQQGAETVRWQEKLRKSASERRSIRF